MIYEIDGIQERLIGDLQDIQYHSELAEHPIGQLVESVNGAVDDLVKFRASLKQVSQQFLVNSIAVRSP